MAEREPTFDIHSIELAGGWSGRVLTGCSDTSNAFDGPLPLPSVDDWRGLLPGWLDAPSTLGGYEVLKYAPDSEVVRATLEWAGGSIDAVGKRSHTKNVWKRIFASWYRSRERRSFDAGFALLEAGIGTAMPLALVERRRPRVESCLISRFIPGLVDLDQVALALLPSLPPTRALRVKRAIVEEVGNVAVALAQRGWYHRDFKASNIMLSNWDGTTGPLRVWLLDLEGLERTADGATRRSSRRMAVRLAASLMGYASVTRTDLLRFVQRYLDRLGSKGQPWKTAYRQFASAAGQYRLGSRKRKTHKLDGYDA